MTDTNTEDAVRVLLQQNGHSTAKQLASRKKLPPLADPLPPDHDDEIEAGASTSDSRRSRRGPSGIRLRHIVVLALAVLVALKPWLVFWSFMLISAVIIILFFSLDRDVWSKKGARAFRWFAKKRPQSAEKLRLAAKRFARRLELLAGKLPDRWVSGLYFPDFEPSGEDDPFEDRPDPFERLKEVYEDH